MVILKLKSVEALKQNHHCVKENMTEIKKIHAVYLYLSSGLQGQNKNENILAEVINNICNACIQTLSRQEVKQLIIHTVRAKSVE